MPDTKTIWVSLSDGARIRIRERGSRASVLFVHGWAMNGGLFDGLVDVLPRNIGAISLDLRGHGSSSRTGSATVEQLGSDLVELADQLGLQNIVVCGWSMGAMALWSAAADPRFSGRVAGYVVVDMSPRIANDAEWRLGLSDGRNLDVTLDAAKPMRADWPSAVRRFAPRILALGADRPSVLAALETAALEQDPDYMAALWESTARQDFRAQLRSLTAPTLAVYGEKSQLYAAASSRFIARESPYGRAVGFQNSGHAPHLEEPQRFAAVLADFVASVTRNASPAASAGAAY